MGCKEIVAQTIDVDLDCSGNNWSECWREQWQNRQEVLLS